MRVTSRWMSPWPALARGAAALTLGALAACGGGGGSSGKTDIPCSLCVATEAGTVQGVADGDVIAFRGIPYAAPPTGELRFKPPQPAAPWSGVRDGSSFKSICPQLQDALEAYTEPGELVFNALTQSPVTIYDNEDCLYLNVWTPRLDRGRRPVMVFIHGGAFLVGGASSPVYSGAALARQDVVMVTLQYRLGALGYLELGGLDPAYTGSGNNGLRDQIAALAWVRRHAAAFGGDPDNITVFGESAGAISVSALLGTRQPQGLFRRAIIQSGAASLMHDRDVQRAATGQFLQPDLPLKTLADLRRASTRQLLLQQQAVLTASDAGDNLFAPAVDGDLVPRDPYRALAQGNARGIDLMVGATQDEMNYWAMYSIDLSNMFVQDWTPVPGITLPATRVMTPDFKRLVDTSRADGRTLDDIYAAWVAANNPPRGNRNERETVELLQVHDAVMIQPTLRMAEQQIAGQPGASTYVYRFQWKVPRSLLLSDAQDLGAVHALDLYFALGNPQALSDISAPGAGGLLTNPQQAAEIRALAQSMSSAWVNFARTGNPNGPKVPPWPAYDLSTRPTMAWRNDEQGRITSTTINDLDSSRRTAWAAFDFGQLQGGPVAARSQARPTAR